MTEWQLYEPGTVPECTTPAWYEGRARAPHLEEGAHRDRLMLAADMVRDAVDRFGVRSVVDLGCGDGGLLSLLQGLSFERDVPMWGYDLQRTNVNPAVLERDVDVRYGDVVAGEVEWGELAVCTEMIEHLVDPVEFVRRIARHARYMVASSPRTETGDSHYDVRLHEDDINLDTMCRPDQTYGFAKLAGEMLAAYAEAEGTRVTIVRPFSGFGTDQALDYPFPSFVDRARRRADPFDIWGDGEQVRDWVHISDVVAGTLAAVEQEVPGPVNLCTGRATSINELAKLVCSEAGYSPAFRHLPAMPSGVHYRVGDPTKLLSFYQPKVTLEEGIRRALEA